MFSVLLFATSLGLAPDAAAGGPPAPGLAVAGRESMSLTLVTGDRVTLRAEGGRMIPRVVPGTGREGVPFKIERRGEHLYVIPLDALALVGRGQMDLRLFDVASLQSAGYGDADRDDVPVILGDEAGDAPVPRARAQAADGEALALRAVQMTAVRQPKARAGEFWDDITTGGAERRLVSGIGKVWLDGTRAPSLDVSVPHIGAPVAWAAGYTGAGVRVAEFSSRGPRIGDGALKPDISAPGVGIVAAKARDGFLGDPVGDRYVSVSGTSTAAPHVSGAAALLAQQHPDWNGDELKAHLMGAAVPVGDVAAQGAGRVDVARAVAQQVHATPASFSFEPQAWPHGDDEARTQSLSYTNTATAPVTLGMAVDAIDPHGDPAPSGMFSLGATTVTVPAGGTVEVPVRLDTTVGGPDGRYTGRVTATAGEVSVTTPVAVTKEVESYDLTVVLRGPDGGPPDAHDTWVVGVDAPSWVQLPGSAGRFTVRVPRGRYYVESDVWTGAAGEDPAVAVLVRPLVVATVDTTIELDARRARPFALAFGRDDLAEVRTTLFYERSLSAGTYSVEWNGGVLGMTAAQFGPEVGDDEMRAGFHGTWAVPDAAGETARSERVYDLAWFEHGRMMAGLSRRVRDAELAGIRADYGSGEDDPQGWVVRAPRPPADEPFFMVHEYETSLPLRRLELVNTDGVRWSTTVVLGDLWEGTIAGFQSAAPRAYRPGRTYRARWNAAVRGPSVSSGAITATDYHDCPQGAERRGDVITVAVPLQTDAAGHRGCVVHATATTRLLRDGRPLGHTDLPASGEFTVPVGAGRYRIETTVDQHPDARLSTRITAAWTFRSAHVDGDEAAALPLMAVRFDPALDQRNRARRGAGFVVPLTVDRAGPVGRVATPAVDVSYDDGVSWTPVRVVRRPGGRNQAVVSHPDRAGYVSLRAKATDDRGNAVEETIIRAYQLR